MATLRRFHKGDIIVDTTCGKKDRYRVLAVLDHRTSSIGVDPRYQLRSLDNGTTLNWTDYGPAEVSLEELINYAEEL